MFVWLLFAVASLALDAAGLSDNYMFHVLGTFFLRLRCLSFGTSMHTEIRSSVLILVEGLG